MLDEETFEIIFNAINEMIQYMDDIPFISFEGHSVSLLHAFIAGSVISAIFWCFGFDVEIDEKKIDD